MTTSNLILQGRDKTGQAFNSVKGRLDGLDRSVSKLSRGFGALAGGAAAGALASVTKNALDSADKIQKLSTRLGASTEALSQYKHVAELSGVSFETLTMGFQRMTRRVAEAANGSGEAKAALKELGVSAEALNQLKPEQQFEVLADALMGVKNPADQVRLAMKLFDSEGVALIQTMQGGSAGLREMRDEADALGKTITQEMADGAAEANDAMTRLSASISGAVTTSILQYSDEITRAADLTREYLPKAIGFLMDVFKGLKATIEGALSFIINKLHSFLSTLSGIPVVGKYFDGMRDSVQIMGEVMEDQFTSTVSSMGKWKDGAQEAQKQTSEFKKETDQTAEVLRDYTATLNTATGEIKTYTKTVEEQAKEQSKAKLALYELELSATDFINKIPQKKRANESLSDSFVDMGDTVTVVKGQWERATDSMFNSLKDFFASGLKDTKSFAQNLKDTFKDMIASILAEITRLIASNVFKKFLGFIGVGEKSSGSIFSGIGDLFKMGGEQGGEDGLGNISSIFTGVTKLFGEGGTIGKMFAPGGFFGSGGTVATTFGKLSTSFSSLATTVPYIALAAAVVKAGGPVFYQAVKKLFKGGARTPQELGEDQLRAVDEATKAGRNTQVQLGSVGGTALSFLGGFDENSTFFGVDLAKAELQKVGDILKSKFGFNQALALKDGVIRLEDFSREFSKNNEEIVAEVQASIAIAKLAFDDAEAAKIKTLGSTLIEFDRVYDAMGGKGLSTADRLTQAYAKAFGVTEDQAKMALGNIGIETERLGEIFDTASNEILAKMTGVATDGLGLFGQSVEQVAQQSASAFNSIEQSLARVTGAAVTGSQTAGEALSSNFERAASATNSRLDQLARRLQDLIDNSAVSRGSGQPLFGS